MSFQSCELGSILIRNHFGSVPQAIYKELQWGPKTFKLISSSTGIPVPLLKRALCTMIQYGFVRFEPGTNPQIAEYFLLHEKVLLLLRYPQYMTLVEDKFGAGHRLLIGEILRLGMGPASKAILNAAKKFQQGAGDSTSSLALLRDAFNELIANHYLMCCPMVPSSSERVPKLTVDEKDLFLPIDLNLETLNKLEKKEISVAPDCAVFWRCNFDRFHQDIRDQILVDAVKRRFDPHAGLFMEILLQKMYLRTNPWTTQSNPVPILEIKEEAEKSNSYLTQFLDQYIKVIDEDSCNFIRRSGEGSTGSVIVDFVSAFHSLAAASIESIVEHRFSLKAARIFRLVRGKKYTDQEQLQKLAMIPDKEAKQITYKLLEEGFIHLHELKKSSSAGPNKNFYLFHTDFNQVVKVVLEMCYKSIHNSLTRADHERHTNARLIEKYDKLNSIAANMRAQGDSEQFISSLMEEWMSPPERGLLEAVEATIKKLRLAELNIDETIFLLNLYTFYEAARLREKP